MQDLEGSGTPVLYIARTVLKGQCKFTVLICAYVGIKYTYILSYYSDGFPILKYIVSQRQWARLDLRFM